VTVGGSDDSDETVLSPEVSPSPNIFLEKYFPNDDFEPVDEAFVTTEATEGRRGSSGK